MFIILTQTCIKVFVVLLTIRLKQPVLMKFLMNGTYDGIFKQNITLFGATSSGKTSVISKLIANGQIQGTEVYWFSSLVIHPDDQKDLKKKFSNRVNVSYVKTSTAKDLSIVLNDLLPQLVADYGKEAKKSVSKNILVFDDLLGIADKTSEYLTLLASSSIMTR